jgi:DNA-binding transcriptional regulator YhcF (GntR family)
MLDHHFWHGEKFTKGQAWIDLILNANHKENKVMIKGRLITVERGEQIRSQVTLAKTWKWNPRTVNKFLELLKSEGMITTKSTELTTHITICNYSTFQDSVKNSAEQTTQHTTEQSAEAVQSRVQTNNNVNNINNDNKDLLPENLKVSMPPDFQLNDTNRNWINDSELTDIEKRDTVKDFIDYWTLDESKKTAKGWQMSFRKNPIVKRKIVNSKHKGQNNGSHQQAPKQSLADRATASRKKYEQQIDAESMGETKSHIRS